MGTAHQRGSLLYRQKRYDLAAAEFRKELEAFPNSAPTMAMLALSLTYAGKYDAGLATAKAAVAADPKHAFVHYALACATVGQGIPVIARKWFRLHDPQAGVKIYHRRLRQAIPSASEAINLAPYDADYMALMASIELDLSHHARAMGWATRGLAINANHVRCATLLAKCLTATNKLKQARLTLAVALRTDPENAGTHAALGWAYYKDGEPELAIHHFVQSQRINPNDNHTRHGLGLAIQSTHRLTRWSRRLGYYFRPYQLVAFVMISLSALGIASPDDNTHRPGSLEGALRFEAIGVAILLHRVLWLSLRRVFPARSSTKPPPLPSPPVTCTSGAYGSGVGW